MFLKLSLYIFLIFSFLHADNQTFVVIDSVENEIFKYIYLNKNDKVIELVNNNKIDINSRNYDNETMFLLSSKLNNIELVKYFYEKKSELNYQGYNGKNALIYAIENKNIDMINFLLSKKIDTEVFYNDDKDVYYSAVESGIYEILETFIHDTKDINRPYNKNSEKIDEKLHVKTTLLIHAIEFGYIDIVKQLVEAGSNINIANDRGELPVLTSLRTKHFDIFEYFFDIKVNFNVVDNSGNSVLSYLIKYNKTDLALKVMSKDVDLQLLFDEKFYNKFKEDFIEEWQISKFKNKNIKEINYLHLSIIYDNEEILKTLLNNDIDFNVITNYETKQNFPSIVLAIENGSYKTFKLLKNIGSDLYKKYYVNDSKYYTLLSYSFKTNNFNYKIVEEILNDKNFDKYITLESKETYDNIYQMAQLKTKKNIKNYYAKKVVNRLSNLKLKQEKGNDFLDLIIQESIINEDIEKLQLIKKQGIKLEEKFENGLYYAIENQKINMVYDLIKLGYSINYKNSEENNLLHILLKKNDMNKKLNIDLYNYLIKKGIDINGKNFYNQTPLYFYIFTNNYIKNEILLNSIIEKNKAIFVNRFYASFYEDLYNQNNIEYILDKNIKIKEQLDSMLKKENLTIILRELIDKKCNDKLIKYFFDFAYKNNIDIKYNDLISKTEISSNFNLYKNLLLYSDKNFDFKNYLTLKEQYFYILENFSINTGIEFYLKNYKELNKKFDLLNNDNSPFNIALLHKKDEYYKQLIENGTLVNNDKNFINLINNNDIYTIFLLRNLNIDINKEQYMKQIILNKNLTLAKVFMEFGYSLKDKNNEETIALYSLAKDKNDLEFINYINNYPDVKKFPIIYYSDETEYVNNLLNLKNTNILFTGLLKWKYENLKIVGHYNNGVREGVFKIYDENNFSLGVIKYENNVLVNSLILYDIKNNLATECNLINEDYVCKNVDINTKKYFEGKNFEETIKFLKTI